MQQGAGQIQAFLGTDFPESSKIKTVDKNNALAPAGKIQESILCFVCLKGKSVKGRKSFCIILFKA